MIISAAPAARNSGITVENLMAVGLSRTAVNRHPVALEKEGYIRNSRPGAGAGQCRDQPDKSESLSVTTVLNHESLSAS
jgi:hypothetical protein